MIDEFSITRRRECNQSALKIQKEQFEAVDQDGLQDPCYNVRIS